MNAHNQLIRYIVDSRGYIRLPISILLRLLLKLSGILFASLFFYFYLVNTKSYRQHWNLSSHTSAVSLHRSISESTCTGHEVNSSKTSYLVWHYRAILVKYQFNIIRLLQAHQLFNNIRDISVQVRPWCGQPSDRGRLRNRTEQCPTGHEVACHLQQLLLSCQ